MEVGDTQLIRNLLCQGLGISYLPEFVVAEDLAKGVPWIFQYDSLIAYMDRLEEYGCK